MRPERLVCPLSDIRRGNGSGEQEEEKRQQQMSATQDATQSGLRLKILFVMSCCYARAGRLLSTAPFALAHAGRSGRRFIGTASSQMMPERRKQSRQSEWAVSA